jgi:hypothetical protein
MKTWASMRASSWWSHYLLLVAVEEAFKNLKGDLAIRPVFPAQEKGPTTKFTAPAY